MNRRTVNLVIENLESKLLLDGATTSISIVSTTSALIAPLPTQDQTQPATVPVSYSPVVAPLTSTASSVDLVPTDDNIQQIPLAPVDAVAPAPAPSDSVPADSFVGPPPAYTGYPVWILNPNYPMGGYNPVIADVAPQDSMISSLT